VVCPIIIIIYTYIRILGVQGRKKKRVTIYLRRLLLDFKSQILDKY